jgi:hypothetical protein
MSPKFLPNYEQLSREWRCKWSPENEKASLVEVQKALESVLPTVKAVDGVQGVQRVVCGGCVDFKVVTTLSAENFAAWEEKGFAPEGEFLDKLRFIDGLSQIETQTYTVSEICRLLRFMFVQDGMSYSAPYF